MKTNYPHLIHQLLREYAAFRGGHAEITAIFGPQMNAAEPEGETEGADEKRPSGEKQQHPFMALLNGPNGGGLQDAGRSS